MILCDQSHSLCRVLFANQAQIQETPEFLSHVLINQLLSVAQKFGASKHNPLVICMDNKSWRKGYYKENIGQFANIKNEEYKGHRDKSSDIDWKLVYEIYEETMAALQKYSDFFIIKAEEAEADDVIAILTKQFKKEQPIWIISSDKDFIQLLDDNVHLYDPMKQKFRIHDSPKMFKKIHIIQGDKGDNIFAIKSGVGEKTAIKMLKDIDTLLQTNLEMKKRYDFNKVLIDFDEIPSYIEERVLDEFKKQTFSFNGVSLMSTFIKYKLAKHSENINKFQLSNLVLSTKITQTFENVKKITEISKSNIDSFFT